MKLKVVYAPIKPGPEYLEVTPDLIERWEKLLNEVDSQIKELDKIFEQAGYIPKHKIDQ